MQDNSEPNILRRAFKDRVELVAYLQATFPESFAHSPEIAETLGGRKAAETCLAALDPSKYATTRNSLTGAVTRLSPYLRHGVVSLAEVRQRAIELAGRSAAKLISELGWRDYFQRVYRQIGDGIWQDREPSKTGWQPNNYSDALPADLVAGNTGLACMDSFVAELYTTGYLHNHARLYLAAYLVHFCKVRWQRGARWFLAHLLDGDPASNNLSWQWVASTFSVKPYYFNRENLEHNTAGVYCRRCPLAGNGCPFDASNEALAAKLFPKARFGLDPAQAPAPKTSTRKGPRR